MKNLPGESNLDVCGVQQTLSERLRVSLREAEVLYWIARGRSNKEVGVALGISEFTVKTHLKRLFARLKIHTRTAAVAAAFTALIREET